jgi:hypothetical protein
VSLQVDDSLRVPGKDTRKVDRPRTYGHWKAADESATGSVFPIEYEKVNNETANAA